MLFCFVYLFVFEVLGIKPWSVSMVGKLFTIELQPHPLNGNNILQKVYLLHVYVPGAHGG